MHHAQFINMMNTIQIDSEIRKKQIEIDKLLKQKDYLENLEPEKRAARLLAHFPRWNEAWGYEMIDGVIDDWTRSEHGKALSKVREMKNSGVPMEHIITILEILTK